MCGNPVCDCYDRRSNNNSYLRTLRGARCVCTTCWDIIPENFQELIRYESTFSPLLRAGIADILGAKAEDLKKAILWVQTQTQDHKPQPKSKRRKGKK